MIEVGVAIAAVQGVKLAITGVKEAAHLTKEAFEEIQGCIEAGKDLAGSMGSLTKFFSSAGKYEERRNQLQAAQTKQDEILEKTDEKPADYISDTEYVLEMMALDRQIRQHYEYIKDTLIYQFSEPGLWAEFNDRLHRLRADREAKAEEKRRQATEERLRVAAEQMRERRARMARMQVVQNILGCAVIAGILFCFYVSMRWMLAQGSY